MSPNGASRPASPLRRAMRERLFAWMYTGPLGHLYGALGDIAAAWAHYAADRFRKRRA